MEDLLDPLEIRMPAAENNAVDGMLVQQFHEAFERGLVQIQFCQDFDRLLGLGLQLGAHLGGFVAAADQDDPPPGLRLSHLALGHQPEQLLLRENQNETDSSEPDHHPPRNEQLGQEQHQHQAERHEQAAFE